MGSKSNDLCPYKKRRRDTETHGERRPHDDGSRDQSHAAANQGILGRGKEDSSHKLSERSPSCWYFDFRLLDSRPARE